MLFSIFADKKYRSSEEEINAILGAALPAWDALLCFIRETYPVEAEFKFMYGKKCGWALRFRVRGKLLTSLYPNEGHFAVHMNLILPSLNWQRGWTWAPTCEGQFLALTLTRAGS